MKEYVKMYTAKREAVIKVHPDFEMEAPFRQSLYKIRFIPELSRNKILSQNYNVVCLNQRNILKHFWTLVSIKQHVAFEFQFKVN